ncbi:hypothetical protein KAR91_60000 [Candidatus Pacearchaeota archaeon]|nr:hypothetical protein [Candidatus Pacearchaeota archaeon]
MKKSTAALALLFTLTAATAQASVIDDIFPRPRPSPTVPEQPDTERMRLSGLSETFRTVIKDKGLRYKGGVVTPDVSTKHLILRFKIPTNAG